jgi:hypothetical protein
LLLLLLLLWWWWWWWWLLGWQGLRGRRRLLLLRWVEREVGVLGVLAVEDARDEVGLCCAGRRGRVCGGEDAPEVRDFERLEVVGVHG